MLCRHGINIKHQKCEDCQAIAEAEGKKSTKKQVEETFREDFSFFDMGLNELDKEWQQQPKLAFIYNHRLAELRRDRDIAKMEVDIAEKDLDKERARLSLLIRKNYESYGLEKVTESSIDSTVILQPSFIRYEEDTYKARRNLIEAQFQVGRYESSSKGLDNRKTSLENLVELWRASYFGEPKLSDAITRQKVREADENLRKR